MFLSFEHFVIINNEEEDRHSPQFQDTQQNFDKISFLSDQVRSQCIIWKIAQKHKHCQSRFTYLAKYKIISYKLAAVTFNYGKILMFDLFPLDEFATDKLESLLLFVLIGIKVRY